LALTVSFPTFSAVFGIRFRIFLYLIGHLGHCFFVEGA